MNEGNYWDNDLEFDEDYDPIFEDYGEPQEVCWTFNGTDWVRCKNVWEINHES